MKATEKEEESEMILMNHSFIKCQKIVENTPNNISDVLDIQFTHKHHIILSNKSIRFSRNSVVNFYFNVKLISLFQHHICSFSQTCIHLNVNSSLIGTIGLL